MSSNDDVSSRSRIIVSLHLPGQYSDEGHVITHLLHESGLNSDDFLINGTVKFEENKAGTFEFDILPSHSQYQYLRRYVHYVSVKEIRDEIEYILFYGRIFSMSLSFDGTKHVICEGLLANLMDGIVYNPQNLVAEPDMYRTFIMSGTPYYMLLDSISAYRNSIRQDISFGGSDIDMGADDLDEIEVGEGVSVGDFIMNNFVNVYGGFLRMEYVEASNGDITGVLYWDKDPSMDNYDEEHMSINQDIEYGVNLLELQAEYSSDEITTGITPSWTGTHDIVRFYVRHVKDVDDSTRMVYKPRILGIENGEEPVGVQVQYIDGVHTRETATAKARNYLNRYCIYDLENEEFDSFTVRAIDQHYISLDSIDRISLYKRVRLKCAPGPYSVNKLLTCSRVEFGIDSPEIGSYTLSDYRPKASTNDKVLTRMLSKKKVDRYVTTSYESGDEKDY